jgi:hypothetical protein
MRRELTMLKDSLRAILALLRTKRRLIGASLLLIAALTGTILAADPYPPLPAVALSASSYEVQQGGTVTISVVLTGSTDQTVNVAYSTSNGTAEAPQDYSSSSGTLTFAPGDTVQSFTVATVNHSAAGPATAFNVSLSQVTNATLGSPSSAVVTITNPYTPPTRLWISAHGNYIVPESSLNAVRYRWSAGAVPESITMNVVNRSGAIVRTLTNLPTTYAAGKNYAEQLWNGCLDSGGAQPLTQEDSPYQIQLTGIFQTQVTSKPKTAKVKRWTYHITIADKPGGTEAFVTGPDLTSINYDTFEVRIKVDGGSEVIPPYSVKGPVADPNGPPGNKRACRVTPAFLFYTTPQTPYNIRYRLVMQQKTTIETISVMGGDIKTLRTVMDGVGNPWDMDPSQPGRQTRAIWRFGLDTVAGTPPRASSREFEEKYE